jgi:hypothetical protein
MGYATVADVQARVPVAVVTIGGATEPPASEVGVWLNSQSLWIDSVLAWRYTVPVTNAADLEILRPICAALVAAQVYSVRSAVDATLDGKVRELRAEALSALVYNPGGVGTWMEGGATVIGSKSNGGIGRALLVLPNTVERNDTAASAGKVPVSTFRRPGTDGAPERRFALDREL